MSRKEMSALAPNGYFFRPDGLGIFYRPWRPPSGKGSRQQVLVLLHGQGAHTGHLENIAEFFTRRGYPVYAFDRRGHGRSAGKRGHIEKFGDYLDDLDAFLELVRRKEPGKSIILIGHSVGGLTALLYALKNPTAIAGLIMSSPVLGAKIRIPLWAKALIKKLARIFPRVCWGIRHGPNWATRDPREIKKFRRDRWSHCRFTMLALTEIMTAMEEAMEKIGELRVPCLLLGSPDDAIVSCEEMEKACRRIKISDKTMKTYAGFYHDLFNELGREKVFKDIENWLSKRQK